MSLHRAFRLLAVACVMVLGLQKVPAAEVVDPAVVGERLQRLTATVESLELSLASQRRQIDELTSELQKVREELLEQTTRRPWADDIKRLADAIKEVDRNRAADREQVEKVLDDLGKNVSTLAEPSKPAPTTPGRSDREGRGVGTTANPQEPTDASPSTPKAREPAADNVYEHVMERGEVLSEVVRRFNAAAQAKGYRALTIQEVMKYNNITDARR